MTVEEVEEERGGIQLALWLSLVLAMQYEKIEAYSSGSVYLRAGGRHPLSLCLSSRHRRHRRHRRRCPRPRPRHRPPLPPTAA